MLKTSSSFVLAGHCRLTISAAFKRAVLYSARREPRGSTFQAGTEQLQLLGVGGEKGLRLASKTLGVHRLAPVRKRDAHYSSRRGPRCGLARGEARLGAPGLGG